MCQLASVWTLVQQQCVAVALRSLKFSTKVIGGKRPDLLLDQAMQVVDGLTVAGSSLSLSLSLSLFCG